MKSETIDFGLALENEKTAKKLIHNHDLLRSLCSLTFCSRFQPIPYNLEPCFYSRTFWSLIANSRKSLLHY